MAFLLAPVYLDLQRQLRLLQPVHEAARLPEAIDFVQRHKRAEASTCRIPFTDRPTTQEMLRTWAVRSKPCFGACQPQSRILSKTAYPFNRHLGVVGYASTSSGLSGTSILSRYQSTSTKPDFKDPRKESLSTQSKQDVLSETSNASSINTSEKEATPNTTVLRENIYTIPNLLTVSRIISCPFLGYFIVNGNFVAATSLLFYAGVSDLVSVTPRRQLVY